MKTTSVVSVKAREKHVLTKSVLVNFRSLKEMFCHTFGTAPGVFYLLVSKRKAIDFVFSLGLLIFQYEVSFSSDKPTITYTMICLFDCSKIW